MVDRGPRCGTAHRRWRLCYTREVDPTDPLLTAVRAALEPFTDIAFAVVFGSAATGRMREDSDLDVAVYADSGGALEIETERDLPDETEILLAIERATGRNVDLLCLNRSPATVCAAAMISGNPVLVRDGALMTRYRLAVIDVAIDFWATERDFRAIRSRSASLSDPDRAQGY